MKIGDKVRFTNDGSYSAPTGSTARVVGTKAPYIQVEWIDKGDSDQMDGSYNPNQFEVIPEYEVGKWYKCVTGYKKFSHLKEHKFYYSEEIYGSKHCFLNDWIKVGNVYVVVNDLSEIQEYLPEDHPDKIVEHFPERWYTKTCTEIGNWLDENSDMPKNCRKTGGYATTGFKYLVYPSMEGSHIFDHPTRFKKAGYEEITFEQFKEHYLKNKTVMSKQKLTVSVTDVLEIHGAACSAWKSKIAKYLTRVDELQKITFTQEEVDAMFEAAIGDQKPVLERIFGLQYKELTLKDIANGQPLFREDAMGYGKAGMIEVRAEDEYKDKAFWLSHLYNWELKTDSSGMLVLIPTPKN
jgi:hypothetical protein